MQIPALSIFFKNSEYKQFRLVCQAFIYMRIKVCLGHLYTEQYADKKPQNISALSRSLQKLTSPS